MPGETSIDRTTRVPVNPIATSVTATAPAKSHVGGRPAFSRRDPAPVSDESDSFRVATAIGGASLGAVASQASAATVNGGGGGTKSSAGDSGVSAAARRSRSSAS